jgi:hypothetical protein
VWLAVAVVVLSVPFAWSKIFGQIEVIRDLRKAAVPLIDKTDFGVLRYVHFLALAYLAWVAVGPKGVRLQQDGRVGGAIALICRVGQQSLAVFAASMVLARVLGAFLNLAGGGALAALAVNLAGFALVIGVARLAAWFKSQPWKTAVARPASEAAGVEVRP